MIEQILDSKVKTRILKLLIDRPKWLFTESEISRDLSIPKTTIHRALKKLRDQNIITESKKTGRVVIFQLNRDNYILRELIEPMLEKDNKIILEKTKEFCERIEGYFDVAIIFGSSITPEMEPTSDIDIALITKNPKKLENKIEKIKLEYLEKDGIIFSTHIFKNSEFKKRYEKEDPLIIEISNGKVIVGDIEDIIYG